MKGRMWKPILASVIISSILLGNLTIGVTAEIMDTEENIVSNENVSFKSNYETTDAECVNTFSIGGQHTGVITEDGSLYMWGKNADGQIGNNSTTDQKVPVKVLSDVVSVSLGTYHSGAITEDGSLYMWGANDCGQIGNNTTEKQLIPVKVLDNVRLPNKGVNDNEHQAVHATQEFIDTHVGFVQENGVYETLLSQYDLATIFKTRGYEELKDDYTAWSVARFNIFDNPYDFVLADWIVSAASVDSQMEVCNMTVADNQRTIINNILSLIEGKVEITEYEKTTIQKLLENRDFSDDVSYKICESVFEDLLKEEDIKAVFLTYDTSGQFMELLDEGETVVNSMIDVINYCSVLDAYNATNKQFKTVMLDMCYWCAYTETNPLLVSAIKSYLEIDNSDDVRTKIMQKVIGESIEVGIDIFGEQLVDRTSKFLLENMDLSDAPVKVAADVTAVVKGMKIGYDIGVAFDNALFNSDNTAQAYVLAHASAEAAEVLREVLDSKALLLQKDPTAENAIDFCETFAIYRNAQMDIANKMIKYLSENNQAFMNRIVDTFVGDKTFVVDSYRWLVRKACWQKAVCHDEQDELLENTKRVLVACPVDVKMYDQNNNVILSIVDDEIEYIGENVAATVRNGIKYISIFAEEYNIEIEATENGVMTYSVSSCDPLGNVLESVHYKNIDIDEGQIFKGNIYAETAIDEKIYALTSNNQKVDSEVCYVPKMEEISISEIALDVHEINLNVGEKTELKHQVFPANASLEIVTWFSEDEKIAVVDEYGRVTAVGYGTTNIVCQTLNGQIESKCKVSVEGNIEGVTRIYGNTRYETGYKAADILKEKLGVEQFDAVVIATGKNFADALAGSYLAVQKNAPIILTNGKDDNVATLHDYIKANVATGGKVYILGGEAAVPASVAAIEGYDVVRLSGPTRYDTNLAILAEAGITGDELIVATGKTFADSLSASAVKMPILLVKPGTELTDGQKAIADAMNAIYIVGGEGAVDAAIAEDLAAYATVERVYGATRQETSVAIAEKFLPDAETVVVASAKKFPDGLCGGPLAAAMNAPLILTKDGGAEAAAGYTAENAITSGYVLGGDGALKDDTVVEVFNLKSTDEIISK